MSSTNRYDAIIEKVFFDRYANGNKEVLFAREDLELAAATLGIDNVKNWGDLIYSYRFRRAFPEKVLATLPDGFEWRIELAGTAKYKFVMAKENRILPDTNLLQIKIPDATPELIGSYTLDDEQALLAVVRYNRLVDIFLGLTCYSLQNHLRTTVKDMGQIEIDELYVGLDRNGCHYIIPVQAKGGKDQISVVQTMQDIAACKEKFDGISCRPISVQFMGDVIAMFELTVQDDVVRVVDQKHYRLVPSDQIDEAAVRNYRL